MMKLLDWIDENKLDIAWLSSNSNAIHILEKNLDKVNYIWLCINPNAIPILEKNLDKVIWDMLSSNPSIFTYDYRLMYETTNIFKEELIAAVFHPKRFERYLTEYDYDMNDL